jgi:tetratricopeptide (TPR) repeat protein
MIEAPSLCDDFWAEVVIAQIRVRKLSDALVSLERIHDTERRRSLRGFVPQMLADAGQFSEALDYCARLNADQSERAQMDVVGAYLRKNNLTEALDVTNKMPEGIQKTVGLVACFVEYGKRVKNFDAKADLLEKQVKNRVDRLADASTRVQQKWNIARLYAFTGSRPKLNTAVESFRREPTVTADDFSAFQISLAGEMAKGGATEQALIQLNQFRPSYRLAIAHNDNAEHFARARDSSQARDSWRRATSVAKACSAQDAIAVVVRSQVAHGYISEAKENTLHITKTDALTRALFELACGLYRAGQYEDADVTWSRARELPRYYQCGLLWASPTTVLVRRGDLDRALQLARNESRPLAKVVAIRGILQGLNDPPLEVLSEAGR